MRGGLNDGSEAECGPGEVSLLPPGHTRDNALVHAGTLEAHAIAHYAQCATYEAYGAGWAKAGADSLPWRSTAVRA
jgi:hypothetical protein